VARWFRSFISDWLTVMQISQVENLDSSRTSPKFWKDLLHNLPAWNEHTIGCFAQGADIL
jgi:hypothetical protein